MFVIVVLVGTLAGQPILLGDYGITTYPTYEACEQARPAVVEGLNKIGAAEDLKVLEAHCFTQAESDKLRTHKPKRDSI